MAAVDPVLKRVVNDVVDQFLQLSRTGVNERRLRAQLVHTAQEAYRQQFRSRYRYVVGEWAGRRRSKSSVTGHFVGNDAVIRYLQGL